MKGLVLGAALAVPAAPLAAQNTSWSYLKGRAEVAATNTETQPAPGILSLDCLDGSVKTVNIAAPAIRAEEFDGVTGIRVIPELVLFDNGAARRLTRDEMAERGFAEPVFAVAFVPDRYTILFSSEQEAVLRGATEAGFIGITFYVADADLDTSNPETLKQYLFSLEDFDAVWAAMEVSCGGS